MSRILVVVLVLAALAGGGYALMNVANSRDDSSVAAAPGGGPGQRLAPTCPERRVNVTEDGGTLSRDELHTALAQGNVVLYGPDEAQLREIQEEITGPFDAELAAAGQMVIVHEGDRPAARAWERGLDGDVDAAALRDFAESWLGKGTDTCD